LLSIVARVTSKKLIGVAALKTNSDWAKKPLTGGCLFILVFQILTISLLLSYAITQYGVIGCDLARLLLIGVLERSNFNIENIKKVCTGKPMQT